MMLKKQFLVWLLQVILFAFLAALQFVAPDSAGDADSFSKHAAEFIHAHRLAISIVVGLALATITGIEDLYVPRKRAWHIRERLLETLRLELLNNDKNNYRVTVFKEAGFFRRLHIYARLMARSFAARKTGKKFSFPQRGRYIIVWHRLGTEHTKSSTFFYCSRQTRDDSQGVAGAAMQSLSDIVADDLPDIANIDLNTVNLGNLRLATTRAVLEYMQKGYINDFDTLKRLNKKARHIYGNVLNDLNGKPKGVLVIDSFLPASFLNPDSKRKLAHYAEMIGATL